MPAAQGIVKGVLSSLYMCFSATASFVASAALIPTGVYALTKAKPKDRLIAVAPLLFGIQQGIEGWQWLAVQAGHPSMLLGYGFLFFAFLFWPWFIPLAVGRAETGKKKRFIMQGLLIVGLMTSLGLLAVLLSTPLEILIYQRCLQYSVPIPLIPLIPLAAGYLLSACVTALLSSYRWIRPMGYIGLLAVVFSFILFWAVFTSVWCFFAAVLSVFCLLHVLDESGNIVA